MPALRISVTMVTLKDPRRPSARVADTDTDEAGGSDTIIAGGVVLAMVLILIAGFLFLRRDGPGKPPRDALRERLDKGVITKEQAENTEALLQLDRPDAPDSIDAALNDLYTRRSSGDITDDQFWKARDAIGR